MWIRLNVDCNALAYGKRGQSLDMRNVCVYICVECKSSKLPKAFKRYNEITSSPSSQLCFSPHKCVSVERVLTSCFLFRGAFLAKDLYFHLLLLLQVCVCSCVLHTCEAHFGGIFLCTNFASNDFEELFIFRPAFFYTHTGARARARAHALKLTRRNTFVPLYFLRIVAVFSTVIKWSSVIFIRIVDVCDFFRFVSKLSQALPYSRKRNCPWVPCDSVRNQNA